MRDRADGDPVAVDLGRFADPVRAVDPEIGEIGFIDRYRGWRRQRFEAALDDVPRLQAALVPVGADDQHRRCPATRLAPIGEPDDEFLRRIYPGDRQHRELLAPVEKRRIVEALDPDRRHPQIGVDLVEHRRDRLLRTEIKAALHRHQHDREHDAGQRHGQAERVVEQIAERQLRGHPHRLQRRARRCSGARGARPRIVAGDCHLALRFVTSHPHRSPAAASPTWQARPGKPKNRSDRSRAVCSFSTCTARLLHPEEQPAPPLWPTDWKPAIASENLDRKTNPKRKRRGWDNPVRATPAAPVNSLGLLRAGHSHRDAGCRDEPPAIACRSRLGRSAAGAWIG